MKTGLPRHLIITYSIDKPNGQRSLVATEKKERHAEKRCLVRGNPGETYILALRDGCKANLNLSLGENVGGGGHVDKEVWIYLG